MDRTVTDALVAAGMDVSLSRAPPGLPIAVDRNARVIAAGDEVTVMSRDGKKMATVRLRRIGELFVGDAVPPDFARGPTPEYVWFFWLIENTALQYCVAANEPETDEEFNRLYRLLGRRPDANDRNPLFSYLKAAARLYMSLRDTSRAEFEAVAARIAQSARTFSMGPTSRNYFENSRRLL